MDRGFDAFRRGRVRAGRGRRHDHRAARWPGSDDPDAASALTDAHPRRPWRARPAPISAILNGGSIRIDDVVPPGPVRQYDVIRVLPFGGKVVSATLDGSVLASVLDAGLANTRLRRLPALARDHPPGRDLDGARRAARSRGAATWWRCRNSCSAASSPAWRFSRARIRASTMCASSRTFDWR